MLRYSISITLSFICLILCIFCFLEAFRKKAFFLKPFFQFLSKYHATFAWILCLLAILHGIEKGMHEAMISGKIAWMILLILILSSLLKKQLKSTIYLQIHRILSIIFLISLCIHIIHAIYV